MKIFCFIIGIILGIIIAPKSFEYISPICSKEVSLTLETVRHDEFLQEYILSPTVRVRTKEAVKQFEEKELKRKNKIK